MEITINGNNTDCWYAYNTISFLLLLIIIITIIAIKLHSNLQNLTNTNQELVAKNYKLLNEYKSKDDDITQLNSSLTNAEKQLV